MGPERTTVVPVTELMCFVDRDSERGERLTHFSQDVLAMFFIYNKDKSIIIIMNTKISHFPKLTLPCTLVPSAVACVQNRSLLALGSS